MVLPQLPVQIRLRIYMGLHQKSSKCSENLKHPVSFEPCTLSSKYFKAANLLPLKELMVDGS